jgi:hypothetical protein
MYVSVKLEALLRWGKQFPIPLRSCAPVYSGWTAVMEFGPTRFYSHCLSALLLPHAMTWLLILISFSQRRESWVVSTAEQHQYHAVYHHGRTGCLCRKQRHVFKGESSLLISVAKCLFCIIHGIIRCISLPLFIYSYWIEVCYSSCEFLHILKT